MPPAPTHIGTTVDLLISLQFFDFRFSSLFFSKVGMGTALFDFDAVEPTVTSESRMILLIFYWQACFFLFHFSDRVQLSSISVFSYYYKNSTDLTLRVGDRIKLLDIVTTFDYSLFLIQYQFSTLFISSFRLFVNSSSVRSDAVVVQGRDRRSRRLISVQLRQTRLRKLWSAFWEYERNHKQLLHEQKQQQKTTTICK